MYTQTARKILAAAMFFSVLGWLPLGMEYSSVWWGPAACLGQVVEEIEPVSKPSEPVVIKTEVESFASLSFTGCSSIIGNALTETSNTYLAAIASSFQGFTGINMVNQAAGSLNNQANWMGVAGSGTGGEAALSSLSYKSQVENNTLTTSGNTYRASITGTAFQGGSGVAMVNQSAGNMNTQLNAFGLTIGKAGENGAISLTDVELCAVKANNTITLDPYNPNTYETERDPKAFKNFTGLWSSNQIAGNMDQVTTVFNVNVTIVP